MNSETTMAATRYRLKEWMEQIRDCQNRPAGMSVADWCTSHGITKANYYYRLRRVRSAYLKHIPEGMIPQQVVPVKAELLKPEKTEPRAAAAGLEILLKGCSIHVTESTPAELLAKVIGVIRDAE